MNNENEIVIPVSADITDIEQKLEGIKKLLDDIKISIQEVKRFI